jgi:hypothetical protein
MLQSAPMNLSQVLTHLRKERARIDAAITALEGCEQQGPPETNWPQNVSHCSPQDCRRTEGTLGQMV